MRRKRIPTLSASADSPAVLSRNILIRERLKTRKITENKVAVQHTIMAPYLKPSFIRLYLFAPTFWDVKEDIDELIVAKELIASVLSFIAAEYPPVAA